jgi:hypothetical protein
MSKLAVANVRKCLDILKRFHEVAKVDKGNEELQTMAKEALDHLDNLFYPEAGVFQHEGKCSDCGVSVQSITQ